MTNTTEPLSDESPANATAPDPTGSESMVADTIATDFAAPDATPAETTPPETIPPETIPPDATAHGQSPEPKADQSPLQASMTDRAPPAYQANPEPRGSALPMVLGGVVAAVIGFGVAQVVPKGWPLTDTAGLTAQITAQQSTLAVLQTRLEEVANAPTPIPDLTLPDRIAALEAALSSLPAPVDMSPLLQRLYAVESQLASLSSAPTGPAVQVDPAALTQLRAEVEALKSGGSALDAKVTEAEARLSAIRTQAEALATATATRAALRQIQAAMDSGAPFLAALADLPADLPEVLASQAASGVPNLQTLRGSYPTAARAALDASLRADAGEGWTARLNTFLRGQTGARSLTPREGTDPDAVLSRAEAALATGDLSKALTELEGLPQPGKDAMAAWLAQATLRQEALAAVQALSASAGQ